MIARLSIVLLIAGAVACGEKKKGAADTGDATSVGTVAPAVSTDAAAVPAATDEDTRPEAAAAGEVPTEQDFEEKAEGDVTAANLEAEVEKLERELGAT